MRASLGHADRILVARILKEEGVLVQGLPGYVEYIGKVQYRLIPLVW